ncbi:small GTPase superfamily [Melampsora americana]|nr:small GTPase superfamily [Melampsora americana]
MGGTSIAAVNKLTIVIVGDGGVGKSSLTLQFVTKEFFDTYDPTIDDSYTITITVDGRLWQIEVLDTAGQEEYRGLWVEHAISEGEAFIVTYAINSTRSFKAVPDFLKMIANCKSGNSGYRSNSPNLKPRFFPFPFAIAGNKEDLIEQRTVPTTEGVHLANASGGLFYECSAKNAVNVDELFIQLIRSVAKLREGAVAHRHDPKMAR